MSSERVGVHTSRALDRDKFVELLMDKHIPVDDVLDALEACVVPDPRIVRIETEVYGTEKPQNLQAALYMIDRVRAILRGDQ